MPKNHGLLIFFDEIRRSELLKARGAERFTDALSLPDWKLGSLEVGLLAFSADTINCVALLKRGRKVATVKVQVEFSELIPLRPIRLDQIQSLLNEELRTYFIKTSRGIGGAIPEEVWTNLINIIKKLRPEAQKEIDRVISLRSYSGYQLKGGISELLVQEREALGSALDIFSGSNQLREKVLRGWSPPADAVEVLNEEKMEAKLVDGQRGAFSFLSRIPERYCQEESAIQHDLFNWQGVHPVHIAGTSLFIQGHRRLEVIYANRNALEKTLGVDLIYYKHEDELFALVQYKLMRKEGDVALYRPDRQLEYELRRMDEFNQKYGLECEMKSHTDFRLNADGFLIKLIPNDGLRPASGELIQGMYLTREYLKFLLEPDGPKGDRDGRVINFENAPRYLTNSDFTHQVNKGWLGMRRLQSQALKDLIRVFYETGRSVLVAYEEAMRN